MTEEPTTFVRVFISDGTFADARLPGTWEYFVHQLVTNGAVITASIFINRSSIVKILRMQTEEGGPADDLMFLEPKGRS